MDNCLGIFVKNWIPGEVKTRLAKSIGAQKAANIYQVFVETTLKRFADIQARKVLAFAPDNQDSKHLFSTMHDDWQSGPQSPGDLGNRISAFFANQISKEAHKVVLIGSDSPNLPRQLVEQAFQYLDSHDVVLGPTPDGGYYLVGCKNSVPPIFRDIPWSTSDVWQTTIDRLEHHKIEYKQLDPWYDVDDWDDLQKLLSDLNSQSQADPILNSLHPRITEILAAS